MHQPGVKLAISQSQVRRPNHYTTEPMYWDITMRIDKGESWWSIHNTVCITIQLLNNAVMLSCLQVILSLERLGALAACVLAFVAVRQLVLCQSTRVVEELTADWTTNYRPHSMTFNGRSASLPINTVSWQPACMVSRTATTGHWSSWFKLRTGVAQVSNINGHLTCKYSNTNLHHPSPSSHTYT